MLRVRLAYPLEAIRADALLRKRLGEDPGYCAHSILESERIAPSCFHAGISDRSLLVDAYVDEAPSSPWLLCCDPVSAASAGDAIRFACRASIAVRVGAGSGYRKGAEVDVTRAWTGTPDEILREWWALKVGPCVEVRSLAWERADQSTLRRTQGERREPVVARRPVADFVGELVVHDPDGFAELLRRGVGRHRAFGLGMVRCD